MTLRSLQMKAYCSCFLLQMNGIYIKDIESTVLASAHISDNDHVTVKLYEEKEVEKAEFYGRFFVKINRNSTFDTNIIASFPALESQYNIKYSYPVYEDAINDGTKTVSDDGKTKKRSRTDLCWTDTKCSTVYFVFFFLHALPEVV